MRYVQLSEVCDFLSGFAWSSKKYKNSGNPNSIPIIRIQNLSVDSGDFVYWEDSFQDKYIVVDNDLLLSMSGNIKVYKWDKGPALLNQRILKIVPKATINKQYLYHLLFSLTDNIDKLGKKSIINNVSVTDIKNIEVPLPSLEEQKVIAEILDKTSSLIEQRKKSIVKLESFLKSSFNYLVGPSAVNESKWKKYKIEELAYNQKGSMRTGPFGSDLKHSEFVDEGICVLGIDNAVNNYFAWGERRYITIEKYQELKRYTVHPGDVIITIMGTTGRSAVVPNDIPTAISTKHLATITLNKELALPEYISYAIHSHQGILKQINLQNKGAIMNGLNLTIIKNLELKVPPIELQIKFKEIYQEVEKKRIKMENSKKYLNDLYNSLLKRVFIGDLIK